MPSISAMDGATQESICVTGASLAGKGIIVVISNEFINDIITIIKSLKNLIVLIDGVSNKTWN